MKKTLMAAAIVGLFSGTTFAADSVTLYGTLDLGVAHYDNGAATVTNMSQGGVSNSRIGLKGKEDLGGGLNAIFKIESGFCAQGVPATGNSNGFCSGGGFFQRQSWVGLQGGFGSLTLGRQYTYSDLDLYDFDPFTDNTVAGNGNLPERWIPVRLSQVIEYDSPSLGGFDFGAQMNFGDGTGANPAPKTTASKTVGGYGLRARYLSGPVRVSLENTVVYNNNGDATVKDVRISGAYNFGIAELMALYGQNSPDSVAITPVITGSVFKTKYFMLGASVPVGPGSILASYTQIKNDTVANAGAKQIGLGYWYSLSKRTRLYVNYAHISNDANALYTVGIGNDAPNGPNGSTTSGVMLGMMHTF